MKTENQGNSKEDPKYCFSTWRKKKNLSFRSPQAPVLNPNPPGPKIKIIRLAKYFLWMIPRIDNLTIRSITLGEYTIQKVKVIPKH